MLGFRECLEEEFFARAAEVRPDEMFEIIRIHPWKTSAADFILIKSQLV
jgi:hypothetical protein